MPAQVRYGRWQQFLPRHWRRRRRGSVQWRAEAECLVAVAQAMALMWRDCDEATAVSPGLVLASVSVLALASVQAWAHVAMVPERVPARAPARAPAGVRWPVALAYEWSYGQLWPPLAQSGRWGRSRGRVRWRYGK